MRSVLLMLMVSVTQGQTPSSPCPASCVVCSEDAIICRNLSSIIEVPDSTKALLLSDGLIEAVHSAAFSHFSNMSFLALSNNVISTIISNAFQKLPVLQTLLLDRNRISSRSLDGSTFSWLYKLETLDLRNNVLADINGSWFQKNTALKTLLLEGNLLTGINSSTFALSDLRNLETLDLSDNLIAYVGRDSFRNLARLRDLDLSRNRLQNAPDAFSHLLWLSKLNLDMNLWSCSCELQELASFLKSFMQTPGRLLHNGQGMACARSDHPAVQKVLELTKANCMPAKSDVRVEGVTKSPITPQRYVRDVALAAAFSCLVGVAITLAILAVVYRKLSKTRAWQGRNGAEQLSSPASAHWNLSEGKDALSISYTRHNSNCHARQPWDKENTSSDSAPDSTNHFICHSCSSANLRTGSIRETLKQSTNNMGIQSNRFGTDQWKNSATQSWTKDVRAQDSRHNGKRIGGSGDMASMRMRQIALRMDTEQIHGNHLRGTHDNGPERTYRTLNCLHCHQTYEYFHTGTQDQEILFGNDKRYTPSRGNKPSNVILYGDILSHTKLQRSLTFDLSMDHGFIVPKKEQEGPYTISRTKMSKTLEEKSSLRLDKRSTKRNSSRCSKSSSQGHTRLKVKLNLNPLRRCQVHPKSSPGHEDKGRERMSRKVKKDKPQADKVKKETKKSKKDKVTKKSTNAEGSTSDKQGWKNSSKTLAGPEDMATRHSTDPHQIRNSELEDTKSSTIHEAQSLQEPVQKSSPLLQHSDQTVTTQPFISENSTDPNRPVSTLEDLNVKKTPQSLEESPENSIPPLQGSDLLTESAGMLTVHHQQGGSNYMETRTTNKFPHAERTNDHFPSVQMSVPLSPSSELLFATTDSATTQTTSMGNITHPQQVMNQYSDLSVSALDWCRDTTTPMCSSISVLQEYLSSDGGSPKRKIRLIIPEKRSNRPQSALDKKIR